MKPRSMEVVYHTTVAEVLTTLEGCVVHVVIVESKYADKKVFIKCATDIIGDEMPLTKVEQESITKFVEGGLE